MARDQNLLRRGASITSRDKAVSESIGLLHKHFAPKVAIKILLLGGEAKISQWLFYLKVRDLHGSFRVTDAHEPRSDWLLWEG